MVAATSRLEDGSLNHYAFKTISKCGKSSVAKFTTGRELTPPPPKLFDSSSHSANATPNKAAISVVTINSVPSENRYLSKGIIPAHESSSVHNTTNQ